MTTVCYSLGADFLNDFRAVSLDSAHKCATLVCRRHENWPADRSFSEYFQVVKGIGNQKHLTDKIIFYLIRLLNGPQNGPHP